MSEVRVRFAPSPTGPPHVGTVHTGLFNWLFAHHTGGKFILRIEDTDREREVPGATEQLYKALSWLGCNWDEGPEVGGACGPYIQSERLSFYQNAAQELLDKGVAYKCWCSKERLDQIREKQRAAGLPTGYDRHCIKISDEERAKLVAEKEPFVIRLKVKREGKTGWNDIVRGWTEFENKLIDDQVLLKADGWPTYHLANVVDDHMMTISHVIRGEDWISSTPKHIMLYEGFGWDPPQFAHLSLLLGPDRSKLSKRHGTTNFMDFVAMGYLPHTIFNFLSILGWSPGNDQELLTVEETIEKFTLEGCLKSGAVFDHEKLNWMNGYYIRHMSVEDLTNYCLPYLQEAGLLPVEITPEQKLYAEQVIALEQERMKLLSEAPTVTEFFFKEEPEVDSKAWDKWMGKDYVPTILQREVELFSVIENWNHDEIEAVIRKVAEEKELGAGNIIHPTRVALTGRTIGPGLFETIVVLGKDRVLKRLEKTLEKVKS